MAMKLFQRGELYNAVKADTLYEAEFAKMVLTHKDHLFPEFFAIKCPHPLPSRLGGDSLPHLILIDKLYGAWYLVMIAVTRQSVTNVVYPRLEHMVQAAAVKDVVPELKALEANLDVVAAAQLLHYKTHETFLLTNEIRPDWKSALQGLKVRIGVLEVFRSRTERRRRSPRDEIYRINGDQPEPPAHLVSHCAFIAKNILEVAQPAILAATPDSFLVFYKDQIVRLAKMPTSTGGVVLHAADGSGVPYAAHGYNLTRRGDTTLELVEADPTQPQPNGVA